MKGVDMGHLNVYLEPFKIVNGTNMEKPQLVWTHFGEQEGDWNYMQKQVCVRVCVTVRVCA